MTGPSKKSRKFFGWFPLSPYSRHSANFDERYREQKSIIKTYTKSTVLCFTWNVKALKTVAGLVYTQ